MNETLLPLKVAPGMYKNGTRYQAAGRWYDGNGIRFIDGTVRPIGGWRVAQNAAGTNLTALTGVPRRAIGWRTDTGTLRVAVGTSSKLYMLSGNVLTDITPTSGWVSGATNSSYSTGATTGQPPLLSALTDCGTWQLDTFGDYLVGVAPHDGRVHFWNPTGGVAAAAVAGAPTSVKGVVCTPERFLVALGSTGNLRNVSWASQETLTTWTASALNTAGDFELATDGRLMCGRAGRGETLLWTDVDMWSMHYIGGTLVYAFEKKGDSCGIVGPNAVAVIEGQAMWMGRRAFYAYQGFVQPVPSDVSDYVFSDFNEVQAAKVWAQPMAQFGEVWWFYPSAASTECDRYVVYNYREKHWTVGTLARTAGFDAGANPYPVMLDSAGVMYEHEVANLRTGMTVFLESGPIELGSGDNVMNLDRLVPDERTLGDVQLKVYGSLFPTASETLSGPYTVGAPTSLRVKARQVRLRLDEVNATSWRVGTLRIGVRQGGKR